METDTLATIGGISILLLLSGIFSGSETALTAASEPRMHLLKKKGNKRAAVFANLMSQREKMLGAILFGNNLVNILASALATSLLIGIFGETGVIYATIAMTILVLIFGEVMPKTYAFHNPDRVALTVAPFFRWLVVILSPITQTINFLIRFTLLAFRINLGANDQILSAQETLRGAIELHQGKEPTIQQERVMLRSILDLAEVDVGEVMHHRQDIVMIDADLPTSEIVNLAVQSPYTRIPLWRGNQDNIIGVAHAKALLRQVHANRQNLSSINIKQSQQLPGLYPNRLL